jgi:hypothetical protein
MNQEREARLQRAVRGEKTSTGAAARLGERKRPAASYSGRSQRFKSSIAHHPFLR